MRLYNSKLLDMPRALEWRADLRGSGRKVVLTNGVFDLLHTGHLHFLQDARALGDALIVCLNSDQSVRELKGPQRPVQGQYERAYALAACWFVDAVLVFEGRRLDPEIRALSPDLYAKAGDYTLEKLDPGERAALESVRTDIRFLPFLEGFSTTALIARIRAAGEV